MIHENLNFLSLYHQISVVAFVHNLPLSCYSCFSLEKILKWRDSVSLSIPCLSSWIGFHIHNHINPNFNPLFFNRIRIWFINLLLVSLPNKNRTIKIDKFQIKHTITITDPYLFYVLCILSICMTLNLHCKRTNIW